MRPSARGPRYARPVLELLGIAAVSFGVGLSGAMSPGPLTVLTIREAARRGWWAGPIATLGHGVIELLTVALLALGLAAYIDTESAAAAVIALAGGAILVWMGASMLRGLPGTSLRETVRAGSGDVAIAVAAGPTLEAMRRVAPLGALVSVSNPYWVIWWATVGAALTVESLDFGWSGPVAVFVGHILSDLVWLTVVAVAVASGTRWMGDRAYRGLMGVCALFLLGIGAYFAVTGVRWFL